MKLYGKSRYNVVICGVGGQGVLTIVRVLGLAALSKGLNVVSSEVHGMAQRGGSVVVHLKLGEGEFSPLIPRGSADLIVAMELNEALRSLEYASENTVLLVNDRYIPPPIPGVKLLSRESIIDWLKSRITNLVLVDCEELALKAGSRISANMAMTGCIAALNIAGIGLEECLEALREMFAKETLEVNVKALKLGFEKARELFKHEL